MAFSAFIKLSCCIMCIMDTILLAVGGLRWRRFLEERRGERERIIYSDIVFTLANCKHKNSLPVLFSISDSSNGEE